MSLIPRDSFVVVQASIYNRRDEEQKQYTVRRLERIQGIWTAMESEMRDALDRTRTELVVEKAEYNVGLTEAALAAAAMVALVKLDEQEREQMRAEIARLRKERDAIILAHYYQEGEIQALADVTGDNEREFIECIWRGIGGKAVGEC